MSSSVREEERTGSPSHRHHRKSGRDSGDAELSGGDKSKSKGMQRSASFMAKRRAGRSQRKRTEHSLHGDDFADPSHENPTLADKSDVNALLGRIHSIEEALARISQALNTEPGKNFGGEETDGEVTKAQPGLVTRVQRLDDISKRLSRVLRLVNVEFQAVSVASDPLEAVRDVADRLQSPVEETARIIAEQAAIESNICRLVQQLPEIRSRAKRMASSNPLLSPVDGRGSLTREPSMFLPVRTAIDMVQNVRTAEAEAVFDSVDKNDIQAVEDWLKAF